jgi:hypothetical protein
LGDKKLEDLLRVIELCRMVQSSSANPFDVDVIEKVLVLKKHLPEWQFLDELLLDSEALLQLAQIVKLQDQWLKHRASSLYIDPLLVQLKVKLLSRDGLADALVKSWHPVAQFDQLAPKGLEKAFIYWRDLVPLAERFKEEFGNYGTRPGEITYGDLVNLMIYTPEQFESRLKDLYDELSSKSEGAWMDYREFIHTEKVEDTIIRAYLLAFLVSDGKAVIKTDPLSDKISVAALRTKAEGEPKSVAISLTGVE